MKRWSIWLVLASACAQPAPARDPRDAERIAALEQKVAVLEAQVEKLAHVPPPAAAPPERPIPAPPAKRPWGGPDPGTTYAVPLDDSPSIGPDVAPVTIVAALQFPEPFTHRVMPTLVELRKLYRNDVRIVVKLFVVHPKSTTSSIAACAMAYQGALEAADPAIWDAAQDPSGSGIRQLDDAELRDIARSLRLDIRQYDQDLATCQAGLARDAPVLKKLGQSGVPAFWINGRPLSGAQPAEAFRKVIDEERVKWKADKARGGTLGTYYERLIKGAPDAP